MDVLIAIFGILLTIFFVIGTHEAAHFIAARLLGVKVLRFSIGFGKSLFHWYDKKGTEYVIAAIPLGGYVKMLDETEGDVPESELHLAYNRQPFYKKFLIVFAGPAANILCALILYWLIFMIGFVTIKPIIGTVTPNSIAAKANLKPNQEIVSIDEHTTSSWTGILFRLMTHLGNQDQLKIETKNPDKKINSHVLDLMDWHIDELNPDPLTSLGIKPYVPEIPLVIGIITPNSPAANSALKIGDKILAINNTTVKTWDEVITIIHEHPDTNMIMTVVRHNKTLTLPITISHQRNLFWQKYGSLGIAPNFQLPENLLQKIQYGPIKAAAKAWDEVVNFTYFNFILFGKMFTGKLSIQSLGGPITIFESAGTALNSGLLSFVGFLAFLSISIGIINLLPIPGLDGGHLFIQLIELAIGRPIPDRYLLILFRLGFIFIIFVLFQALVNDILRLY